MQFHRNSGSFRAGQRVRVADWQPGNRFGKASNFSVYKTGQIAIAAGDRIRITAGGKTKGGQKLENGKQYMVDGFTDNGDIRLTNHWIIPKDFGHLTHGYVATSHASQGKTVDRVLIAMGSESMPAMSAEQFYVSASRARDKATVYSDMTAVQLREAIQRSAARTSATELMSGKKRKPKFKTRRFLKTIQDRYRQLREKANDAIGRGLQPREQEQYAR
jgi:ATP-dependent exoDNAse (exonuclease V) alpha subunit